MKSNAPQLKEGDILSETQYYTVVEPSTDGYRSTAKLKNERGLLLEVGYSVISDGMYVASQFRSQETVTRTRIVEIMMGAGDDVFTVNYNKKVKDTEVFEQLKELYPNNGKIISKIEFDAEARKMSKQVMKGEERTLVGKLISPIAEFGRFKVTDLEIALQEGQTDTGARLVDQSTINSLILRGVKYIVK